MNEQSPEIKALLQTDEEFNQLAAQHHQLEDRLQQLTSKHYLSEPEQVEETTLKKRKLALKDRMEMILRQRRQEHPHSRAFAETRRPRGSAIFRFFVSS